MEATVAEIELPINFKIYQIDPDRVEFKFSRPSCDNMRGPLFLHADTRCYNEWCNSTSTMPKYSFSVEFLKIDRLIPYSNYTVGISAGRQEANQGLKYYHTHFRTRPKRENFK